MFQLIVKRQNGGMKRLAAKCIEMFLVTSKVEDMKEFIQESSSNFDVGKLYLGASFNLNGCFVDKVVLEAFGYRRCEFNIWKMKNIYIKSMVLSGGFQRT